MPMTPDDMIRLLEKNGFVYLRSNGSHRTYYNATTNKQVVVPYHKGDLKKGLESSILKMAGLK